MINSLYQNAASCTKWNNQMSNTMFKIEQGVKQLDALCADLYKVYINPLLNIPSSTGLGGKIEISTAVYLPVLMMLHSMPTIH